MSSFVRGLGFLALGTETRKLWTSHSATTATGWSVASRCPKIGSTSASPGCSSAEESASTGRGLGGGAIPPAMHPEQRVFILMYYRSLLITRSIGTSVSSWVLNPTSFGPQQSRVIVSAKTHSSTLCSGSSENIAPPVFAGCRPLILGGRLLVLAERWPLWQASSRLAFQAANHLPQSRPTR